MEPVRERPWLHPRRFRGYSAGFGEYAGKRSIARKAAKIGGTIGRL
jgi:hypothetical protein